jgi:DNA-binding SARP family transcriptional activator/TolB-like protein/Tfp pilus assembly protein PilF
MGLSRLELLGGFAIRAAGEPGVPVRISSKKSAALLAYLAMHPNRCASREQLATLLWGERLDQQARHSLRECLRQLHEAFASSGSDPFCSDREKIGLRGDSLVVDADEFRVLAGSADFHDQERAVALYRGEFLAEFDLRVEAFGEWIEAERSRLRAIAAEVFERRAERFHVVGDGRQAIDSATRLVALDPLREDWQQSLLRLLARYEGRDAALAHARGLTARLKRELGVEPAPATMALVADIERGSVAPTISIATGTAPQARDGRPSIAVLPFLDLRQHQACNHFCAGVAIDVAAALSRIRSLSVTTGHATSLCRIDAAGTRQVGCEVGRELEADYLLDGSVRTLNGRLRVTARLVDAETGHNIWTLRYDWTQGDMFDAQDEIGAKIAACIEPHVYAAEGIRARRQPPQALDVRGCVMRAFSLINHRSRQNYALASELLRRAIDLDPHCTQAYSLLAYITALEVVYGWKPREHTMGIARDAANTAVLLDADAPWAHFAVGFVHAQSRSTDAAIRAFEKALALNPSFCLAHTYLGSALSHLGRSEAAIEQIEIAERLNPRPMFLGVNNYVRANAHFAAERYREASMWARRSVLESPGIVTSHRLVVVNSALAGEADKARRALDALLALVPGTSLEKIDEALPYSRDSDRSRFLDAFSRVGLD